jgi:hypothetical protein
MTLKTTLAVCPKAGMRQAIVDPFVRFNAAQIGRPEDRPIAILLSDPATDGIVGGL